MDGGDVDGGLALVEIGQGLAGGEQRGEEEQGGAHRRQPEKGLEMARIVTKWQPENGFQAAVGVGGWLLILPKIHQDGYFEYSVAFARGQIKGFLLVV